MPGILGRVRGKRLVWIWRAKSSSRSSFSFSIIWACAACSSWYAWARASRLAASWRFFSKRSWMVAFSEEFQAQGHRAQHLQG